MLDAQLAMKGALPEKKKRSVLVVDDDTAVGQVLCALLVQSGFTASVVPSAESALSILAQKPFDAVLSDLRMPKMNGLELLAQTKRLYPDVPVVLISAHGSFDDAVEALRLGAADFVKKPFDRDEVAFVMKKVIDSAASDSDPGAAVLRSENASSALDAIVGRSAAIESMREVIAKGVSA